MKIAAKAW